MSTSTKRQDYITWDEYFMGVAMLSGMRSKDPNTQVGACMAFLLDVRMMNFHGHARVRITNIIIRRTVN